MVWLLTVSAALLLGAGLVVAIRRALFKGGVAKRALEMWQGSAQEPRFLDREYIRTLPPVVARYAELAFGHRGATLHTARLRQTGAIRTKLDGPWLELKAQQYFASDPPAFVWWGRAHVRPGFWFDARDESRNGAGRMTVSIDSTVPVVDRTGPDIDQGSLVRLLGELVWVPSALFDPRYVTWEDRDRHTAIATLVIGQRLAELTFHFGPNGLPDRLYTQRYRDEGRGRAVLCTWSVDLSEYRLAAGVLVPFSCVAYWHEGDRRIPYVRLDVARLQFDVAAPFGAERDPGRPRLLYPGLSSH